MSHVSAAKSLTLDQWVDAIHADWREPRCPKCGTDGKWRYKAGELALNFECGGYAEIVFEGDDYLIVVYRELVASCRPRAPLRDRHRLWRYAE
jgi:hypothetical protein